MKAINATVKMAMAIKFCISQSLDRESSRDWLSDFLFCSGNHLTPFCAIQHE
jgi:hypothetical protein